MKKGEIIVNFVKTENFTEKDRLKIIRSIREHTSMNMSVVLNEVGSIPRGANGKVINIIIDISGED